MTEDFQARRDPNRQPIHPGAVLREAIEASNHTMTDIADRLCISRQHLYDVINEEKPISPNVAARLGKLFGNGGGVWLRMQAAHDLWSAERDESLAQVRELNIA